MESDKPMKLTKLKPVLCGIIFSFTLGSVWAAETDDVVLQENFDTATVGILPDSCTFSGSGNALIGEADGRGKVLVINQPQPGETGPFVSLCFPPVKGDVTVSLKLQPETFSTLGGLMLQNRGSLQYVSINIYRGSMIQYRIKPTPGSVLLGACQSMDSNSARTSLPGRNWFWWCI